MKGKNMATEVTEKEIHKQWFSLRTLGRGEMMERPMALVFPSVPAISAREILSSLFSVANNPFYRLPT
jgi:hypothetical protein